MSKYIVGSFSSTYTPGLLTSGITGMFSPATTFDTLYFKNPELRTISPKLTL